MRFDAASFLRVENAVYYAYDAICQVIMNIVCILTASDVVKLRIYMAGCQGINRPLWPDFFLIFLLLYILKKSRRICL
jgi:hypothetical protein